MKNLFKLKLFLKNARTADDYLKHGSCYYVTCISCGLLVLWTMFTNLQIYWVLINFFYDRQKKRLNWSNHFYLLFYVQKNELLKYFSLDGYPTKHIVLTTIFKSQWIGEFYCSILQRNFTGQKKISVENASI